MSLLKYAVMALAVSAASVSAQQQFQPVPIPQPTGTTYQQPSTQFQQSNPSDPCAPLGLVQAPGSTPTQVSCVAPSGGTSGTPQFPTGQTGQVPGQLPGQIPGQIPSGQFPPGYNPYAPPGQIGGQLPGQLPPYNPYGQPGQIPGQLPPGYNPYAGIPPQGIPQQTTIPQPVLTGVPYNVLIDGEEKVITFTSLAAGPYEPPFVPTAATCNKLANNNENAAACTAARFLLRTGQTAVNAFRPTAALCAAISVSTNNAAPLTITKVINQKKLAKCAATNPTFKGRA